jgi:maltose alpha-D-glucosyltransferase/alpha-amylase
MARNLFFLIICILIISNSIIGQNSRNSQKILPDFPDWVHNAVFYQIYPQTFYDSNGDGIGDLNGIILKLDYVKSLGADAIWLNPFFDSPFNDAGYDIRDYYNVAPRYGTNEDAKRLFVEAHKRGMKVIFDYVITYTAIDHPWFVESCKGTSNKYTNWYVWTDNVWKMEEGEFANRFIQGYGQRNGNFMRNFYWSQPALNFGFGQPDTNKKWQLPTNHPDVLAMREELKRIFCYWMDMGADGIRADMAGALVKGNDINGDTKKFWQEIRQIVKEKYPQAFMVSEWSYPKDALDAFHADFFHWFDGYNDLTQKESWRILNGYSEGNSYFDKEGKGNIAFFLSKYMDQYSTTKTKGYIILPLGNHDNARMNVNRTPNDLEIIMAFGMTMPGIPFIYYGNEIGMRQLPDRPQIEGAYKPRSGARTPMQWTSGKNCGFSTADFSKLYLPVDTNDNIPNVEDEQKDPSSLLNRVKKLIELKHNEPALAGYADFIPLYAKENTYPFIYSRVNGKDAILVVLNPSEKSVSAEIQAPVPFKKLQLLAGKELKTSKTDKTLNLDIPGISFAIYKLK